MFSCLCLILYFTGSFGARNTNTDIIRQYKVPINLSQRNPVNTHQQYLGSENIQTNDYVDRSGRIDKLRTPMQVIHASKTTSSNDEDIVFKIHQPREDPKLYYQSEAYLKEINGQNVNHEITFIYPGREVIRGNDRHRIPKHLLRSEEKNRIKTSKLCIKCPHDRKLIAKVGVDKVILQNPALYTCSGRKAPSNVSLIHMYGPKFGTLLQHGTHIVVGRIMHKNETLRICKIHVHVIVQRCSTPKHLIAQCTDKYSPCSFRCRNKDLDLQGESLLFCGDDMKWRGNVPTCKARNWCKSFPEPDVGKLNCKGMTSDNNLRFKEGTKCRIQCPTGWHWSQKAVTVCRRGSWTNDLKCLPKKKTLNRIK